MKNNYPTVYDSVMDEIDRLNTEREVAKKLRARPYMLIIGFVFAVIGFELMRQVSWKVSAGAFFIWWGQNVFRKFK